MQMAKQTDEVDKFLKKANTKKASSQVFTLCTLPLDLPMLHLREDDQREWFSHTQASSTHNIF